MKTRRKRRSNNYGNIIVNYGEVQFVKANCICKLSENEKKRITVNINKLYSCIGLWSIDKKYSKQKNILKLVLERSTPNNIEFKRDQYYVHITEQEIKDGFGADLGKLPITTFRLESF